MASGASAGALSLSIVYETEGVTPVSDIIAALQAANEVSKDVVSLLPSFFEGLKIEASSLNVRSLTQESPLREYFLLALIVAFQDGLKAEVPPMIEDLFNVRISEDYDTLVTVIFMIVVFYGASIAIDGVKKAFTKSLPKAKLEDLIHTLALETGRPAQDIRSIIEARFEKPAATTRLLAQVGQFFLPSQKAKNAPVRFDRDVIPTETIREIPYSGAGEEAKQDFSRYRPHTGIDLDLHAQHFLLSAAARTLSLKAIYKAGEAAAHDTFCKMRWPETNGDAVCPDCGADPVVDYGFSDAPFAAGEEIVSCPTVHLNPDAGCGAWQIGAKRWNTRTPVDVNETAFCEHQTGFMLTDAPQSPADPVMEEVERAMSDRQMVAVEPMYLICKHGGYYRPNCQGYTSIIHEAGRYTLAEAISETHPNGPNGPRDGMYYTPDPLAPRACATEGCDEHATIHFVRGNVGSDYCGYCYLRIASHEQERLAKVAAQDKGRG